MTQYQEERIPGLISIAESVAGEVETCFLGLTGEQLNWKPSADSWSVAQCLDHLRTANNGYFPAFEKALQGDRSESIWAHLPWIPAFWGKALIKVVSPETAKKGKAPKIFHPASSTIDETIVRQFLDQQTRVIHYLRATDDQDLGEIIIPSPVTPWIAYSLLDSCRIIVAHEKRHLRQAVRVSEMDGFPGGSRRPQRR